MTDRQSEKKRPTDWSWAIVGVCALFGLGLIFDQSYRLSATFDEVTYLEVGAKWWRTGEQSSISRMGTPLTFWKVQQTPTLWLLDRLGHGDWIDTPIKNQARLLPLIRIGESWIWVVSLLIASEWARRLYGHRAMALTAVVFTLEPNLLAHGALSTMETPVIASVSGMFFGFWWFLKSRKRWVFWATAILGGLAMSSKFTTILIPPILAIVWTIDLWTEKTRPIRIFWTVIVGMSGFGLVMILSDLVITGFSIIPLSVHPGPHPSIVGRYPPLIEQLMNRLYDQALPQDWIGFANQSLMQRGGAPSYLFEEHRTTGWWYYYPVALAVKLPLGFLFLILARCSIREKRQDFAGSDRSWVLPLVVCLFLFAAMFGSKRNFGVRYLLPVAAPAIVWTSGLAESGRKSRIAGMLGVGGMGLALVMTHPHELAYFNELAGGSTGGRKILSDSNLDWGQGAKALARLQRDRPELRDLTCYYFGQSDPGIYGVKGRRLLFEPGMTSEDLPPKLPLDTQYLAVSATLQWGPFGLDEYFRPLLLLKPVCYTDDTTIAIYRTQDLSR